MVITMIGILCALFNIIVCVGLPAAVFIVLWLKSKIYFKIFLLGGCGYFISQLCIRQPILSALQNLDTFRLFSVQYPAGQVLFLSITAALVEESARYIIFRFVIKKNLAPNTPLCYGLGHGGLEAVTVGINNILLVIFSTEYLIKAGWTVSFAGVERISTQIAQVAFSFIVFYSLRNKRLLILAIFIHTLYNFAIVLLSYGFSQLMLEILLLISSVLLLWFTIKKQKGERNHEEIQ